MYGVNYRNYDYNAIVDDIWTFINYYCFIEHIILDDKLNLNCFIKLKSIIKGICKKVPLLF